LNPVAPDTPDVDGTNAHEDPVRVGPLRAGPLVDAQGAGTGLPESPEGEAADVGIVPADLHRALTTRISSGRWRTDWVFSFTILTCWASFPAISRKALAEGV